MQMDADDNVSLGGSVGTITPIVEEEIVVMSTTTSEIAGEFSVRSTSTNKYLACSESGTVAVQTTAGSPYRKWYFQYLDNSTYKLIPMARQDKCLSYYDDVICLVDKNETEGVVWTLEFSYADSYYISTGGYYYLSPNLDIVQGFDQEPPGWKLGDHIENVTFLTSVSIASYTIFDWTDSYIPTPEMTRSSSSASYSAYAEHYDWIYSTSTILPLDIDFGLHFESAGLYQVRARYKFNPSIVSNSFTVIISDDYDITSGAMYLIRPSADISKLLTMTMPTQSTSHNTLSLQGWVTEENYVERIEERWRRSSQAFSIAENNENTYVISAIMPTEQYAATGFSLQANNPNAQEYLGSYALVDKNQQQNTLSMTSNSPHNLELVARENSTGSEILPAEANWYIYVKNSNYYIVNETGQYYLSYVNYNGSYSLVVSSSETNSGWIVSFFGIDAPAIRQCTTYYCSVASTLQVLCGINHPGFIGNIDLGERMRYLDDTYNITYYVNDDYGYAGSLINATHALNSILGEEKYIRIPKDNLTEALLKNYISTSLTNGSPAIVNIISRNLAAYYPDTANYGIGHFVCIIGYDSSTGMIAISDCTYPTGLFGIHLVTPTELFNALADSGITYRVIK